jgi:putative membrane protein
LESFPALTLMLDVRDLPALNAILNSLSTLLLLIGYALIRAGRRDAHRNVMIAALVCSGLFLTSYLIYHYQVGSVKFPGTGAARTLYLSVLLTHTVLAATVPFLAAMTVVHAWRKRWGKHTRIAKWTLPIWLYVSVTGVIVYWMLYQMKW